MNVDWKIITGIASALAAGGLTGYGTGSSQVSEIQILLESRDAAHERAIATTQEGYRMSLELISKACAQ